MDPLPRSYPELTPYQFASNRPIDGVDLDGLEYLRADESHVQIKNGIVQLKVENFNWNTRTTFNYNNNQPSNWKNGEIDINTDVFIFKLEKQKENSPKLASMGNGLKGPKSWVRPYQKTDFETKKHKADGFRMKNTGKGFYQTPKPGFQPLGRRVILVDLINNGYVQYDRYTTRKTKEYIKDHADIAIEALGDIRIAIDKGMLADEFINIESISLIANYLLQGEEEGMSEEMINVAKDIFENISSPTLVYPESGLDGFQLPLIDVNLNKPTQTSVQNDKKHKT